MAAVTAPYQAQAQEQLAGAVAHVLRVVARPLVGEPVTLSLSQAQITFDESWAPHVQARFQVADQDAAALLEALDPRYRCRLTVEAGYRYAGQVLDVHNLATLHVRSLGTDLRLEADSDEALAMDRKHTTAAGYPPRTGINELVSWAAGLAAAPDQAQVVSEFPPGYGANMLTELELDVGGQYWDLLADAANRVGVWLHVGEDGRWYIKRRPALGRTAANLHAGPGGTLVEYPAKTLNRDAFQNSVCLNYTWTDDATRTEYQVVGLAEVPGAGRLGVERIGRLTYAEDRAGPVTQAQATAAAETVLSYRISQGAGYQLKGAAAYWLRPGMTVTVRPHQGAQERHLIQSVTFEPLAGLMTITTRQPES